MNRLAWAIAAAGAALRLRQYAADRSLWLDEIWLAENVLGRSLWQLAQPLDNDQAAPLGFLAISKLMVLAGGSSEFMLRLFPLLCGLASIALMYRLTPRPVALALFCTAAWPVYYASEFKQYSSDIVCFLLIWLAAMDRRRLARLGLIGAVCVWFSHPAVFALCGAAGLLAWQCYRERDGPGLRGLALVSLAWAASFGALYLVSLRAAAGSSYLAGYWSHAFLPIPPWRDLAWFWRTPAKAWIDPIGLPPVLVALAPFGLWSLYRRQRAWFVFLSITVAAMLAASALRKYPMAQRLLLFATPAAYLVVSESVELLRGRVAQAMTAALLLLSAQQAWSLWRNPRMAEHIEPVIRRLELERRPGDAQYIYYGAAPALRYYHAGTEGAITGGRHRAQPENYAAELLQFAGRERVWVLFSHVCERPRCAVDEREFILERLDRMGARRQEFFSAESSLYLYDLR